MADGEGEFYGDSRLEAVMRDRLPRPPAEFSDHLLDEIDHWRRSTPRQDDITFVVVDIEGPAAAGTAGVETGRGDRTTPMPLPAS